MNDFSLPCNVLVRDISQLSYQEWLEIRRSGIGGSDAAASLGLSSWKSPIELWEEKVLGKTQPKQDSEPMRWGRLLEPVIRDEFAKRTGYEVSVCRSMLQAPQWPWMQANLDGLIEIPGRGIGVFEVKTASTFKDSDWGGNDDSQPRCPDAYALQVAHYLAVTGLEYAVICVLIGGNKLRWLTVERDVEFINSLVELERRFWQYVLTQTPPPVDGSLACAEMLARKFPTSSNASPLILPADADDWIRQYWQAKAEEDAAGDRKLLMENRLKEVMGAHEKAVSPSGHQVTWKTVQSCRVDTAKLKKEEPTLFEKFSTTSATRRFSVSEGK